MIRLFIPALLCACISWCAGISAPASDIEHNTRLRQEFRAFNPDYERARAEYLTRLLALHKSVIERERERQPTVCSRQILAELKVLITGTAGFDLIGRRLRDLESTLAHPEREAAGEGQSSADGSWGGCFDAWYLKLDASCDHMDEDGLRPSRFLDRINSPEKLTDYLTSIATSDVARTGVDHLLEFNLSLTNLTRLIVRGLPKGYPWDPRLKQVMMDLVLHRFRSTATGWWGETYIRDGQPKFVDDLSTTFHIVNYLEGGVPDLPRVADTALAVKDLDFPVGWLWRGRYWNHNNMDVAILFAYAWPHASAAQRRAIGTEIGKMLQWCLHESLRPDGSFTPLESDLSIEEANYFGTAFLARIGYFDKSRRFWTAREFPESDSIRERILVNLKKHAATGGAGGAYYRSILRELGTRPAK